MSDFVKDSTVEKEQVQNKQTPESEDAKTVGQFLKNARLSQKKTIESAAKILCIRKIYLNAIEEDNYAELPPIPYGVGFVRSYAAWLGLNAERIVQCYKEEAMPQKSLHTKPVVKNHPLMTIPNWRQILIGIVAVAGLYFLWLAYNMVEQTSDAVQPIPEVVAVEEESQELITPLAEELVSEDASLEPVAEVVDETIQIPEENVIAEESAKDSRIVVKFKGESWFEIRDDEKVYIRGIYDKGFEYNVPNVAGLIFSVGKHQNVDVYIDGKVVEVTRPQKQTNINLDEFLNH